MIEIVRLQKVIRKLHGLESTHLRSECIRESLGGEIACDGVVEVFTVYGHPRAELAYAWSYATHGGGRRYVAVLGLPPVASALDAVRASLAGQHREG